MTAVPAPIFAVGHFYDHAVDGIAFLNAVGDKIPALLRGQAAVFLHGVKPFLSRNNAKSGASVFMNFVHQKGVFHLGVLSRTSRGKAPLYRASIRANKKAPWKSD